MLLSTITEITGLNHNRILSCWFPAAKEKHWIEPRQLNVY